MLILLAITSLIVGILIGTSGVGGVLLIPALVAFGGLDIHQAMATALFSFFFTGIAATVTFQQHGSIDWKITVPVLVGSIISSYIGAMVNANTTPLALTLTLAIIIIVSSAYSLWPLKTLNLADTLQAMGRRNLLLGIGLFVGFFCGLTGIGGGILSLPIMLVLGFAPLASIGTGQVLQMVVAVFGSIPNIEHGFVIFSIVWWVTIVELIGVFIGVKLAHMVPVPTLKKVASFTCLLIGIFMLVQAL